MTFKELHHQDQLLHIANVWDVPSTLVAEKLNFKAVGTSSWAVAKVFGYEDGEEITFKELKYLVSRILASTKLPVSVDIEGGYSRDPLQIAQHIIELAQLGVLGINLEDSIPGANRSLLPASKFAKTLETVTKELHKANATMYLNIRIDAFILGMPNALAETLTRIALYEKAGANGIFVPCLVAESDIKQVTQATALPINVLTVPGLPEGKVLQQLGVKRLSMGNALFDNLVSDYEESLRQAQNLHR